MSSRPDQAPTRITACIRHATALLCEPFCALFCVLFVVAPATSSAQTTGAGYSDA